MKFYSELDCIISLKSTRRISRSTKIDIKLGFTLMTRAELNTSVLEDPFVVIINIKIEDAVTQVLRLQTNGYKYSTWREDRLGILYTKF